MLFFVLPLLKKKKKGSGKLCIIKIINWETTINSIFNDILKFWLKDYKYSSHASWILLVT